MLILRSILLVGAITVAAAAHGQTAPATASPQTSNTAPAAISPAATGAQAAEAGAARNSATRGSRGAAQSRRQGGTRSAAQAGGQNTQGGGTQPAAGTQPGITGVPGYNAGFSGPQNTPAPAATADVVVTGVNDGSKRTEAAVLPGVTLMHNALGIAKGTPIHIRLRQPVDSGHAKNGDTVYGVLTAPVGGVPAGAPVQLTVVAVAAAGQMFSNGELSLQVVSVNGERVLSDVITAEGKEGAKIMPDDAPGRGTEAIFTPDQPLTLPAG